jgi:hypothetical protein
MSDTPSPPTPDPVWELLRQASPPKAGPRFVDDTLRTARAEPQSGRPGAADSGGWRKLFGWRFATAGGLTATAAAILLVVNIGPDEPVRDDATAGTPHSSRPSDSLQTPPATGGASDSLALLDDAVATEALSYAAEDPGAFTDAELVSLIAY